MELVQQRLGHLRRVHVVPQFLHLPRRQVGREEVVEPFLQAVVEKLPGEPPVVQGHPVTQVGPPPFELDAPTDDVVQPCVREVLAQVLVVGPPPGSLGLRVHGDIPPLPLLPCGYGLKGNLNPMPLEGLRNWVKTRPPAIWGPTGPGTRRGPSREWTSCVSDIYP